jgi:CRP-like cAMP-binding protein
MRSHGPHAIIDGAQLHGALRSHTSFQNVRDEDWPRLLKHFRPKRFQAGDVILEMGDVPESICVIGDGVLRVLGGFGHNDRVELCQLSQGAVFGQMNPSAQTPATSRVEAVTPGLLWVLSQHHLADMNGNSAPLRKFVNGTGNMLWFFFMAQHNREGGRLV